MRENRRKIQTAISSSSSAYSTYEPTNRFSRISATQTNEVACPSASGPLRPEKKRNSFSRNTLTLDFLIFYLNSRISAASRGRARNESPAQSVAAPCGQSARRSGGARRTAFHTHFYNIVACFRFRFHCAAKNNSLKITRHTGSAHCLYAQNSPTKFVQDSQFYFDVGKRSRNFLTDGRQCAIMSKSNANPNDKGESA